MTTRQRILRPIDAMTLAVAGVVHLPGLVVGPSLDASVFGVVGWRMVDGALPYRDVWDHKPPGIFLINAVSAQAGDLQWAVVWALSVVAIAVMGVATRHVVSAFAVDRVAALAGVATAAVSGQYLLALGGGLTEPFAAAVAMVAVASGVTARSMVTWGVIGVALGVSVATSTQLAPAVAAVCFIALVSPGQRWRALGSITVGLAAVALATVLVFRLSGILDAGLDALLHYNAAYRVSSGVDVRRWSLVPWTVLATLPLLAPAMLGALRLRAHPPARVVGLAATVWIVAGVGLIALQDRFYAHYAIGIMPPLAILAAVGVSDALANQLVWRHRAVPAVLALVVAGISVPVAFVGAAQEAAQVGASSRRAEVVGAEVRALTTVGDTILVWGNEPLLYRIADRSPATKFTYMLPLVTPGYATGELVDELVEELDRHPPAFVVDAGSPAPGEPGFPELLIARPSASDGRGADPLDPLRAFVESRYALDSIVEGWPLYRHIHE